MQDSMIVDLYLQRDESAICHTSEKYGRRLQNLSFGIVQDLQTAEECESDTYVKTWDSIPPHEPRNYLYNFLARIIRNISLNCCRSSSRLKRSAHVCQLSTEMEQCIPAPDNCLCRLEEKVLADAINGFLRTLPAEKRNIFLRRYWYMDSIADISRGYRMTQSKIKTTLLRCREQLRQYLIKEGYTL